MARKDASNQTDADASKRYGSKLSDEDLLQTAKEKYTVAIEVWGDQRDRHLEDVRFAVLGEQWPEKIKNDREQDQRPCLTLNKQPAFIRQVVNDARMNKPSIKVHPVDSQADPKTADVMNGLIRNIEQVSVADIAYDTGAQHACEGGWGFWRVKIDWAHDDSFDKEIRIERIADAMSVLPDPYSTAADSSDWNCCFVLEKMPLDEFTERYGDSIERKDWEHDYKSMQGPWRDGEDVLIAEYWWREEQDREILRLSDERIVAAEDWQKPDPDSGTTMEEVEAVAGITVADRRTSKTWRVYQALMTGADVLERVDWVGKHIPVVPVYGDEVNVEGERRFHSLIYHAKDAQRQFNYWRSASTELLALAPRVPWIGPTGFADSDGNWDTANLRNHPYLEYDSDVPPQRQPLDSGPAAGALQEALNANDDMKAIIGLHDASLGARSNETSGRAIWMRQREGDTSTFHFQDNMVRAVNHTGRILLDLIPKVYRGPRIIRTLGEDGTPANVPVNQPHMIDPQTGAPMPLPGPAQAMPQPPVGAEAPTSGDPAGASALPPGPVPTMPGFPSAPAVAPPAGAGAEAIPAEARGIFDLAAGKYDLVVSAGPSFTTRREEAAYQMTEFIRSVPSAALAIGDLLVKNLDWPQADEIAERIQKLQSSQMGGDPEKVNMAATIDDLSKELAALKREKEIDAAKAEAEAVKIDLQDEQKQRELDIRQYEAETKRIEANTKWEEAQALREGKPAKPEEVPGGSNVGHVIDFDKPPSEAPSIEEEVSI